MNSDDCIVLLIIVLALDMAMLVGCCIYGSSRWIWRCWWAAVSTGCLLALVKLIISIM